MIDVTLAFEDANSKLVDVATVADEDLVGSNLLQISKLRFGKKHLLRNHIFIGPESDHHWLPLSLTDLLTD